MARSESRERELEEFLKAHEQDAPSLLGRAGLAARVAIYVLIASLIIEVAAVGHASAEADTQGAFAEISRQPAGFLPLAALAIGLAAYAAWRIAQAVTGSTRDEGMWARIAAGGIGLLYVVLTLDVVHLLWSNARRTSSAEPQQIITPILRWGVGGILLGAVAVLVALGGIGFAIWGARRELVPVLHCERMPSSWLRAARITSAIGDVGRGIVVCLVAAALLVASIDDQPRRAKGVDQALASLRHYPGGPVAVVVLGLAFLSFAAFSVIEMVWGRY